LDSHSHPADPTTDSCAHGICEVLMG
jgi:hypothetical protein